ncbi:MAG: monothiol glutaredoxin, Grx4 family [Omnitrophica WOR_2 bacterium GWA2_47_8]|nr:MAG: monothiol glutaredoxin, Grx4 family [Omnitrophica WOR_2 bacterium GWA2_47_8]
MDEKTKQRIENDIKNNKIFLYMKGTPDAPMCGFSGKAVEILKSHNVNFGSFNIFEDEAIRQGVKEYSEWPTFPQLYVNGELVGGCDIMVEMEQNGELAKVLETAK